MSEHLIKFIYRTADCPFTVSKEEIAKVSSLNASVIKIVEINAVPVMSNVPNGRLKHVSNVLHRPDKKFMFG